MALDAKKLKIVTYPARVLRIKTQPLAAVTDEVRGVAARMLDLMHEAPGVGLAAPQVGLSWRMFVAIGPGDDRDSRDPKNDQVFINPVLSDPSRETEDYEEGCLSIPQVTGMIRRPKAVTIEALDLEGQPVRLRSDQLHARIWQHETDHLDGILIIDRMTPMDRMANQRALREMEKE